MLKACPSAAPSNTNKSYAMLSQRRGLRTGLRIARKYRCTAPRLHQQIQAHMEARATQHGHPSSIPRSEVTQRRRTQERHPPDCIQIPCMTCCLYDISGVACYYRSSHLEKTHQEVVFVLGNPRPDAREGSNPQHGSRKLRADDHYTRKLVIKCVRD
jgi:hypothetical protein